MSNEVYDYLKKEKNVSTKRELHDRMVFNYNSLVERNKRKKLRERLLKELQNPQKKWIEEDK